MQTLTIRTEFEAFERVSKQSNANSNNSNGIRMQIRTIRKKFETFESKFEIFKGGLKQWNAKSNHSNQTQSIRLQMSTL